MRLLIHPKVMREKTLALASGHTFLLSTYCLSANTCTMLYPKRKVTYGLPVDTACNLIDKFHKLPVGQHLH